MTARLGLALFLTGGLVAGLVLVSGMTLTNPYLVRASEGFFLWVLALISCVTGRRTQERVGNYVLDSQPLARG